jgi:hypothetical protein
LREWIAATAEIGSFYTNPSGGLSSYIFPKGPPAESQVTKLYFGSFERFRGGIEKTTIMGECSIFGYLGCRLDLIPISKLVLIKALVAIRLVKCDCPGTSSFQPVLRRKEERRKARSGGGFYGGNQFSAFTNPSANSPLHLILSRAEK